MRSLFETLVRSRTLYVKVYESRFVLYDVERRGNPITVVAQEPFSSNRYLISKVRIAIETLKTGFREIAGGKKFLNHPRVLIQPKEKVSQPLEEADEWLLRSVAEWAGACNVIVRSGQDLSEEEVQRLLDSDEHRKTFVGA